MLNVPYTESNKIYDTASTMYSSCDVELIDEDDVDGTIPVMIVYTHSNCSIIEWLTAFQEYGARGVVLMDAAVYTTTPAPTSPEYTRHPLNAITWLPWDCNITTNDTTDYFDTSEGNDTLYDIQDILDEAMSDVFESNVYSNFSARLDDNYTMFYSFAGTVYTYIVAKCCHVLSCFILPKCWHFHFALVSTLFLTFLSLKISFLYSLARSNMFTGL